MHHFTHFEYDLADQSNWKMTWKEWMAVVGSALGAFMAILDIQITNASLREIQGALGLDIAEGGWISTSYLLAEMMVIPLTGFLSVVFGLRRYLVVNCFLFVVASVLCGLSWNLPSMIVFRFFQGFVGGTLIPMAFEIMLLFMPQKKKAIGLAIFGVTATLAPTLGPSLGGYLTDAYGWRTIFFINVAPGALMMTLIYLGIPNEQLDLRKLKNMDFFGAATLMLGLGCLTYVLEDGAKLSWFEDEHIQICSLVSLACLSLFIVSQIIQKNPLLNLKLLLNRNFGLSALVTMMTGAAFFGGIYSLSLYLGQIQNYSASDIGQVMMWVGIPQLFVMPLLPFLMKRVDLRILALTGMLLFAYSNYMNAFLSMDYSGQQLSWSLIIRAIGQPLFMIPLSQMAMSQIAAENISAASSIFNMLRNLGGSIGIAVAGTFVVSRQSLHLTQYMEHLSPYSFNIQQALYGLEQMFRQKGMDVSSSKLVALKSIVNVAQRDAYVQSFSDIFGFLAGGIILCILFISLMKKVTELSHHVMD